mgnify:CR=1 FL=1
MILLDTHIWVWWISNSSQLSRDHRVLLSELTKSLAVSIISCWEIAKLVEVGRLTLDRPVADWLDTAIRESGVEIIALSPRIVVESTQLPGNFHKDPADQLIVATARVLGLELLTADQTIRAYPHVKILG